MVSSQSFHQALENLNPAQKKAVETIYGPVLVIAGPGTGKTQVLATRIANILVSTDAKPGSILALTFTESGTAAMRSRLLELIGPTAHSVKISTFHGFCQDLITEFPEKFLFAKKLQPIEDIVQIQLLQEVLAEEECEHLRPYKSPHFFLKDILRAITALKKEAVSPQRLKEVIDEEKRAFEAIPETEKINSKTGKMKQKYAEAALRIAKSFELQRLFSSYQQKLAQEGYYDFDDMITSVLSRLKEDEALLWSLRERFLFLLVDEFQDTNGAQMELTRLFAGDEEQPNVFAVGDDDQSIYRFQGASLENILTFQQAFPDTTLIFLTENYRSGQEILDAAEAVISANEERLVKKIPGLQKHLRAVRGEVGILPEIHVFPHREREHFFLAEKIREIHELKNISYGEVALLVRSNAEGFALLDFLEKQNLPASFSGQGNALESGMVRRLLKLLRLIQDPEDDALFFECLHFRFFHIPVKEIWDLWERVKKEEESRRGKFWKFWRKQKGVHEEQFSMAFRNLCDRLEHWQRDLRELSLPEFFQKVCTESGLLDQVTGASGSPGEKSLLPDWGKLEDLNHLNTFFAELRAFSESNHAADLEGFLSRLSLRQEFQLPLPERDLVKEAESVQILTAHKAKGLEFEAVFIVHGENGRWGDQRHTAKISLPEGLLRFAHESDPNEEERRLFYVAMTRAKKVLFFTRSEWDENQRERAEARFLSEIPHHLVREEREEGEGREEAFEILKTQLLYHSPVPAYPTEFLKRALSPDTFALSPSAFENFRENPQKFLWENVLQIPQVTPPVAALGTALHRALEEFIRLLPEENEETAMSALEESLRREALTEREFSDLLREGREKLGSYLKEYRGTFLPAVHTEFNFRSHRVFLDGEIPLTGKVDKIEWLSAEEKTVKIVDYKLTAPRSENEIRGIRESDLRDITAGRYFRQLVFYSLLAELSPQFPYRAEEFEIDFLLPAPSGALKKLSLRIRDEEKEKLKEEIRRVWKKIQNLDFKPVNLWGEVISERLLDFFPSEPEDNVS